MKVRNFKELRESLEATSGHAERSERHRAEALDEILHYRLAELRRLKEQTQVELSKAAGIAQPVVSRIERDADPNVTIRTLRRYVEGLGGKLEVAAVFDGERLLLEV